MQSYTLIITEKPDAAARMAYALDLDGKPRKRMEEGVPFYIARRNEDILIVPALGHLYTVGEEKEDRLVYPAFEYKWIPLYEAKLKAKNIRTWIATISKLAKKAGAFIDACDFDIEGSVIGYNILRFACDGKQHSARRMKYSTLTKEEIERAYLEALPALDFALIEAGCARHEVDWLYGVNLSRALTNAARKMRGSHITISSGRVQGPTLRFVARREKNIQSFVPTPYWTVKAVVRIDKSDLEVDSERNRIDIKEEAERIAKACKGKSGRAEAIENTKFLKEPPPPFDLTSLQTEAYRLFGYTPVQTSKISQRLYIDALISYPRTSSQKLPPAIGHRAVLEHLVKSQEHGEYATHLLAKPTLTPRQGRGEDQAHPAIYPTGNLPDRDLGKAERNIWNLMVRRYMAAFGDRAIASKTKITVEIEGHRFHAYGVKTVFEGWMYYYRQYIDSYVKPLPPTEKGGRVEVRKILVEEKFTRPPPRYNPSTILRKMQKEGIGTKATRAGIIQTLYDRKFISGRNMEVTELGFEVADVLLTNCPAFSSPYLTKKLEEKMAMIQNGKMTREDLIREVIATLKPITEKLKDREQAIGTGLNHAFQKTRLEGRTVGNCPTCKTGRLLVVRSKKTSKRFLGCTQYFEGKCKTAFPLPQQGLIRFLGTCRVCNGPKIKILLNRKHPLTLCLNPQCSGKRGKH